MKILTPNNQKGFGHVELVLAVLFIGLFAFVGVRMIGINHAQVPPSERVAHISCSYSIAIAPAPTHSKPVAGLTFAINYTIKNTGLAAVSSYYTPEVVLWPAYQNSLATSAGPSRTITSIIPPAGTAKGGMSISKVPSKVGLNKTQYVFAQVILNEKAGAPSQAPNIVDANCYKKWYL